MLAACSRHTGDTQGGEGELRVVSIAYLKSHWNGHPVRITEPWAIRGRVVSSDKPGNFYKSLIVQDETGGIEILLDRSDLYYSFPLNSCVEVSLLKLTLGGYGGFVRLGADGSDSGYQADHIPDDEIDTHMMPCGGVPVVTPNEYEIEQLTAREAGTLVRVVNVQFIEEDLGLPWAEEEAGERMLVNPNGSTLAVRTLPYARFADRIIPSGSGFIEGILYSFNGGYSLRILDAVYLDMSSERFAVFDNSAKKS